MLGWGFRKVLDLMTNIFCNHTEKKSHNGDFQPGAGSDLLVFTNKSSVTTIAVVNDRGMGFERDTDVQGSCRHMDLTILDSSAFTLPPTWLSFVIPRP